MVSRSPQSRPKMWEYQSHFRASASTAAQEVFGGLDAQLRPEVALIGVNVETGEIEIDGLPGMRNRGIPGPGADPELLARLRSAGFDQVQKPLTRLDSHELRDSPVFHVRNLVLQRLETLAGRDDYAWYVSVPVRIGGHIISTALGLDRATVVGYSGTGESDAPSYDITHSLLNAVIFEFLNTCYSALLEPDPGSRLTLYAREHTELIRSAANQLMFKLTYRTRQWGYPVSLFDACNAISALRYEGEPGIGTMVIAERERVEVDVVVELLTRVGLTDHRGTRKLLEMATEQMCLLSDAGYIYGLGRCTESDPASTDGMVRVDFTGHYAWEVSCDGRPLMRVINGHPQLPGKPINETRFREAITAHFCGIAPIEVDRLWEIALEASRQQHGTLIVITTGARFEAERLGSQCIRTKPMIPSRDVVRTVTAIDGALLLSPDGTCHAIGVILDGLSSRVGNPMRGSRYNSAVRYVETSRRQFGYVAYAIVVSEDGMIDLIEATGDEPKPSARTSAPPSGASVIPMGDRTKPDLEQKEGSELSREIARLGNLACAERIDHPMVHESLHQIELHRDQVTPEAADELRRIIRLFGPGLGDDVILRIEELIPDEKSGEINN